MIERRRIFDLKLTRKAQRKEMKATCDKMKKQRKTFK